MHLSEYDQAGFKISVSRSKSVFKRFPQTQNMTFTSNLFNIKTKISFKLNVKEKSLTTNNL